MFSLSSETLLVSREVLDQMALVVEPLSIIEPVSKEESFSKPNSSIEPFFALEPLAGLEIPSDIEFILEVVANDEMEVEAETVMYDEEVDEEIICE